MKKIFKVFAMVALSALNVAASEIPPVMIAEQRSAEFAVFDFNKNWLAPSARLWSFCPKNEVSLEIPCSSDADKRPCYALWGAPSDIKSVLNNTHFLCVDSLGGVMLVRMADKKIIWHVYPRNNPHSAELLPDGNVVTASSEGNYLRLYDIKKFSAADPGATPFKQYLADDPHGVVWDKKRQRLWCSGMFGVSEWKYHAGSCELEMVKTYTLNLPDTVFKDRHQRLYGHDLYPTPEGKLFITTRNAIYIFDPDSGKYELFKALESIKSCDSVNGKVMLLKPQERWWAEGPLFPDDEEASKRCSIFLAKIYKARFFKNNDFSY